MTQWFLITSALMPDLVHDHTLRFTQTLQTLDSIQQHCVGAHIVLLETSRHDIPRDSWSLLLDKCDEVLRFHDDPAVSMLHQWTSNNLSLIKSPNEALIMSRAMQQLNIESHDRVFKISGRYQLTSEFNLSQHTTAGSVTMLRRQPAVTYYRETTGESFFPEAPWQYKTRLYSFCGSLRWVMMEKFTWIFYHIIDLYQQARFNDLEHCMFLCLQDQAVREIDVMGVAGMQMPSREIMRE